MSVLGKYKSGNFFLKTKLGDQESYGWVHWTSVIPYKIYREATNIKHQAKHAVVDPDTVTRVLKIAEQSTFRSLLEGMYEENNKIDAMSSE